MIWSRTATVCFGVVSVCALLFCSGCGPGYGSPVKVSGTVTVDDKPLAGALVTYRSTEGREAEYSTFIATTEGDGSYQISKVYPGSYEVIVAEPEGQNADSMEDPGMISATTGQDLQPTSGTLKTDVGTEDHTYDVTLKRGPISKQ